MSDDYQIFFAPREGQIQKESVKELLTENVNMKTSASSTLKWWCRIVIYSLLLTVLIRTQNTDLGQPTGIKQTPNRLNHNPSLRFEQNQGQTDSHVDFLCRSRSRVLFVNATEAVLKFQPLDDKTDARSFRIVLCDANPNAKGTGLGRLPSTSNYFIGGEPAAWRTGIPHFTSVMYEDVYPDIDLLYDIREHIEFDFIIDPGADPAVVRLAFNSVDRMELDGEGDLIVHAGKHQSRFAAPYAYQEIDGIEQKVDVYYILEEGKNICFNVGPYDENERLVIDPPLIYSTYLGGSGYDTGYGIAVDKEGNAYVTGTTGSSDFPTFGAFQNELAPGMFSYLKDVFITKLNKEGNDIIYSTYLGGRWDDSGESIAVDANGNACVTGWTGSDDDTSTPEDERFPLMKAYQTEIGGSGKNDAFVAILNASGSGLVYSTYLGGKYDDEGTDIAVDESGNVYVTGNAFSFDFPIKNAFMDKKPSYYFDAFVTKLNPSQSGTASLIYSTFLGGDKDDYGYGIAVDREGCACITGETKSSDFPTTLNAIQSEKKESSDVFVTKLTPDGSSAVYSTYLGSDGSDEGSAIEVDTDGCAFVSGIGGDGFPTTPGTFMPSPVYHRFLSKLNDDGSDFVYSTHTPASGRIAVDDTGQVYIAASRNINANMDAYVLAFNPEGTDTLFSLTLGGSENEGARDIAVDADRSIYIVGTTSSTDFHTESAFQPTQHGKTDVCVAKFGIPKKYLVVEVIQDPLDIIDPSPISNTPFEIFSIDLSKSYAPLTYLETLTTDNKGLLYLDDSMYWPGMPIFIRNRPQRKPAAKTFHEDVDGFMYEVFVDNLIIDKTGNIEAQTLESDANDTTTTYMAHTSIGFRLTVSIEWLALPDYISSLRMAFVNANNYIYDIADGQAFIDQIAIYDNKRYWDYADIRIHANNQQWPEATVFGIRIPTDENHDGNVFLPPIFCGDEALNTAGALEEPLNPNTFLFASTIVHELGHYMFGFYDEYRNVMDENIDPFVNYGFMDDPSRRSNPMSSEMSAFTNEDYMDTEHFCMRFDNCWGFFQSEFSNTYGELLAKIHTPEQIGLAKGQYVEGPNNQLDNPDFSVGEMMDVAVKATTTTEPRRLYQATDEETGAPVPLADVVLEKQGTKQWINHGWANHEGKIRLFNAEPGDKIFISKDDEKNYKFREFIVPSSMGKRQNDAELIELKSVQGHFTLLSRIVFDASGDLSYVVESNKLFAASPTFRMIQDDVISEDQKLKAVSGVYFAPLPESSFSEGVVLFSAPDSLGETFFVTQKASVLDLEEIGDVYISSNTGVEIAIDKLNTTASHLAVLVSDFPPPTTGLPDSVLRVSPVYSMYWSPASESLEGRFKMRYFADSLKAMGPEAITLFRWDNEWLPLATSVDVPHTTASTQVENQGHYAVFLDLKQAVSGMNMKHKSGTIQPERFRLHQNHPNPFNPSTKIGYDVMKTSHITIEILDILGRKVCTLVDDLHATGTYATTWDGCDSNNRLVAGGIYIYRLSSGSTMQIRKMILIR